jgi:WD40 repeat protein
VLNDWVYSSDLQRFGVLGIFRPQLYELDPSKGAVLRGDGLAVADLAWGGDGRTLASGPGNAPAGAAKGGVVLWDVTSGQPIRRLKSVQPCVNGVAFSPDGSRLAGASQHGLQVWDTENGKELFSRTADWGAVNRPIFTPDGSQIVTHAFAGGVQVWDAANGQSLRTIPVRIGGALAMDPAGKLLAAWISDARSSYGKLSVYDLATGQELRFFDIMSPLPARAIVFSPDSKVLASTYRGVAVAGTYPGNGIKLWEVGSGREKLTLWGHTLAVQALAFSPDGTRLASADRAGIIKVWDLLTEQEVLTLKGHTKAVTGLAFSPDGHRQASCSEDGTVRVWDATPME